MIEINSIEDLKPFRVGEDAKGHAGKARSQSNHCFSSWNRDTQQ